MLTSTKEITYINVYKHASADADFTDVQAAASAFTTATLGSVSTFSASLSTLGSASTVGSAGSVQI